MATKNSTAIIKEHEEELDRLHEKIATLERTVEAMAVSVDEGKQSLSKILKLLESLTGRK